MEYGHVVLANSKKDFFARVIKFITRSNWSHSLLTIPSICNEDMGLEAAASGVSAVPMNQHYRQDPTQGFAIYSVKVNNETKDRAIRACLLDLQTAYGHLELPWFGYRALMKLIGKDVKRQDNWCQAGTICSELVVKYLCECGLGYLFKDFGLGSVNAQDLEDIMRGNPDLFELIEVKE